MAAMVAQGMSTRTFRDAVALRLSARAGQWVNADDLMTVGGKYAFRTRVSECRRQLGMTIENKVERNADGVATSWYRYVPPAEDWSLTA